MLRLLHPRPPPLFPLGASRKIDVECGSSAKYCSEVLLVSYGSKALPLRRFKCHIVPQRTSWSVGTIVHIK
ncbi:hypothetical protein Nepgr_019400 [Nepenthes gracilis]|uniref:Uncharacterized protein n=1 Tax=Nepenthes gracilis TaxID=150966 RepID=A0AAD3SV93_NEPGR|nr:hypothetical protein Nepgr_019400 [Nepenthes gracilis]